MPTRRLRVVLAAGLLAPLLVLPGGADAVSTPLACPGATRSGPWQVLEVEPFSGVEGVATRDVVTGYAADPERPKRLLATNGNTVKTSGSFGCEWDDGLVLDATPDDAVGVSGTTSTIVATALLPGGPALAAVREGSGPASRPHVAVSRDGRRGSWRLIDDGLPAQGAPRLLQPAGDGRTAYLVMTPLGDGGTAGGTLPGLPGGAGAVAEPAGSLYATRNGGQSWEVRAPAGALPTDAVDGLAVDQRNPDLLYVVAGGRLLVSTDGGRSLRDAGLRNVRAVVAMEPGELAVSQDFDRETGLLLHSTDSGRRFAPRASVRETTSMAYRRGDAQLLTEASGRLYRVDARRDGRPAPLPAPLTPTPRTTLGDRSGSSSYTVLAEHAVLRFVDLTPGGQAPPPVVIGDLAPPPPPNGRVEPAAQRVTMPVGESRQLDYTLLLPPGPTPLDLVFLIDTSPRMARYIDDLRTNLFRINRTLTQAGVDVKVGLATAGPGPADGEPPYPEVGPPGYRKPALYRLLRAVGPVDDQLRSALNDLRTDDAPQTAGNNEVLEGQLFSLQDLVLGEGLEEESSSAAAPRYAVRPKQKAGFRKQLGIRRLVIHATDEPFNNPRGTPRKADGTPDLERVAKLLAANRIQQAGISPGETGRGSLPDLRFMAERTGALAPPGGLDCTNGVVLQAGDPLVCQAAQGFTGVITDLVRALADRQDVSMVPVERTPVLGSIDLAPLRGVDVTRANALPLRVRVSCVDVAAGTFTQRYTATLRGFAVAEVAATVTCTAPAAAAAVPPPKPPAAQLQDPAAPAGQPAAQAPAPPAPAPPVVQPQAQPQAQAQTQVQAQVNPVTAAVLQQQEQLQLALALSSDERAQPGSELAMVDRGRSQELRALALLSVSMAAVSTLGLARLRTRRSDGVRVGRIR